MDLKLYRGRVGLAALVVLGVIVAWASTLSSTPSVATAAALQVGSAS